MTQPPDPALLQRLRALRRQELERMAPRQLHVGPESEAHQASLTQVHDDVRTVLVRIDAAEAAMRPVLQAWAADPARGGAHLLGEWAEGPETAQATQTLPTAELVRPGDEEQLPDTLAPDAAPLP